MSVETRHVISTLLLLVIFVCTRIYLFLYVGPKAKLRTVAVLVLGDAGRSPRMMYHAESFTLSGFETVLIGYKGATLIPSLRTLPNFRTRYISQPPEVIRSLPWMLLAPLKILHQIFSILDALLQQPPEFIIVQNPPTIPTLALTSLVAHLRGSKIIIDWHNLGYSILALRVSPGHPLVRVAKWFECYFGRTAFAHLFVTLAMRDHLVKEWDLQGEKVVLHDRPPAHFHSCTPEEFHELLVRLRPALATALVDFLPPYDLPYSTPFTTTTPPASQTATGLPTGLPRGPVGAEPRLSSPDSPARTMHDVTMPRRRDDRPALLVSSTSWTEDEDFGLLRDALTIYEERATRQEAGLPKVLVVVTGRGPLKERYMRELGERQRSWKWVRVVSVWLEAEDYPLLLGSADLGISLHSSSSALDLPMKVVDMFGCGLPVCALDFACLNELVKDNVNGLVFKDASQLASQLIHLLTSFPNSPALKSLQTTLARSNGSASDTRIHGARGGHAGKSVEFEWGSWEENWNRVVRPLVLWDERRIR